MEGKWPKVVVTMLLVGAALILVTVYTWPHAEPRHAKRQAPSARTHAFDITWPLTVPAEKPLLRGELSVRGEKLGAADARMVLRVSLVRPSDEDSRKAWNARTSYPQYRWMRRVRVWDDRRQWLWPNLAFLLKLHGRDRQERYGGWDPGKDVDNDFGAVLIRKFNAAGTTEHPDTRDAGPLVSANWHTADVKNAGRGTVAHTARSDEFTVHLLKKKPPHEGRIKLWFVYADFMGTPAPKGWPKDLEHRGGALAFFRIDWHYEPGKPLKAVITQKVPPEPTGFDWPNWVGRDEEGMEPIGRPRRTDRPGAAKAQD
jgi:hypothetical protein